MWCLAAIGLFTPGCGTSEVITLHGAGATFPEPLYKRWFREYYNLNPSVRISYQGLGSGAGIRQFTAGLVDFGASDSAMNAQEIKQVPEKWGVQLLPMTSGCVVLAYNVPDLSSRLRLTREVYAKIFLGKVTNWNDSAIVRANPGVKLPDLPITVVRRSDGSGTTFVLTKHLSAISPEWKAGPGVGKSVQWPTGIGSKGNPGVAFTIDQTPGAIGYLEYSYTINSAMTTALLENASGAFIEPSTTTAQAALARVEMPADLVAWVPDPDGPDSYPIVSFTWILCRKVYDEPEVGETIKQVLLYGVDKGQTYSRDLGYVPLPEKVARQVRMAIEGIKVLGAPPASRGRGTAGSSPQSSAEVPPLDIAVRAERTEGE
jgi:phosphate transport system substrate-binding protein